MVLPGVVPRVKTLLFSGFGYLSFLIAQIFALVRLLPQNHPYLHPGNIGRYGIRHAVAEAANNLVISPRNIDQILVFGLILAGMTAFVMQLLLMLYGFVIHPVLAAPPVPGSGFSLSGMFKTINPNKDIAFIMLDEVFGIPNMFDSCVTGKGAPCYPGKVPPSFPWPFHQALRGLLQFYSTGLLIIGLLIFLYFVVVVIFETATTGSPFGQRFENLWVPVRIVVAIGLLVPLGSASATEKSGYGLNASQYIVLYAAKLGSGFASNAWNIYNRVLVNSNPLGERDTLLALPEPTSPASFIEFMSLVHGCKYAYERNAWDKKYGTKWKADKGDKAPPPDPTKSATGAYAFEPFVKAYFVKNAGANDEIKESFQEMKSDGGADYDAALKFFNNGSIFVAFGEPSSKPKAPAGSGGGAKDPASNYIGGIIPLCGTIRIPIYYISGNLAGANAGGAEQIQRNWYKLLKDTWFDESALKKMSYRFVEKESGYNPSRQCEPDLQDPLNMPGDCKTVGVPVAAREKIITDMTARTTDVVTRAWDAFKTGAASVEMTQEILDRGWAGAGIWYNKIADVNGTFVSAAMNIPMGVSYPAIMDKVRSEKAKVDPKTPPEQQFTPNTSKDPVQLTPFREGNENQENSIGILNALSQLYIYWHQEGPEPQATPSGNFILDTITSMFGLNGLIDLHTKNLHIHPLAQLTAVGKTIVETSILALTISVGTGALGGFIGTTSWTRVGTIMGLVSSLSSSFTFFGLTAGIVLYYVLPFLPFLYFFFAATTWIKTIFEAMIGAPLWALAHLRIDGSGLPGDAASTGYYLILEIFLRPILSVIALIASILILTASIRLLNLIWPLALSNLTGFEAAPGDPSAGYARGTLDKFFFTIMYTAVAYTMAVSSFKLIDAIPDGILRYLGSGDKSFSDINQDPTGDLQQMVSQTGLVYGQKITGSITQSASGLGGVFGSILKGGR